MGNESMMLGSQWSGRNVNSDLLSVSCNRETGSTPGYFRRLLGGKNVTCFLLLQHREMGWNFICSQMYLGCYGWSETCGRNYGKLTEQRDHRTKFLLCCL